MQLRGHGLRAQLPRGWEGRIRREAAADELPEGQFAAAAAASDESPPVMHLATFALPGERGDFGSGAVDLMADDDAFVALLEYGPEEAGTPLFAAQGLPRRLDPRAFSNRSLQRAMRKQAGWQHFFTEAGRAFCLYVVLGDGGDANRQVRRVEEVLAQVTIEPAAGGEEPR
ncbi:hypothetical protein [Egicoccus sp. AB-alg2]|uniref:hypothetical protein n=1 Tax=Egicoccus sp. AB-alg2 TaxID=3242693 RepID=UPI00359ED6BE